MMVCVDVTVVNAFTVDICREIPWAYRRYERRQHHIGTKGSEDRLFKEELTTDDRSYGSIKKFRRSDRPVKLCAGSERCYAYLSY
jgi:hypothetical protein